MVGIRKFFPYSLIPVCLALATLAMASSRSMKDPSPTVQEITETKAYCPYWYIDELTDSVIEIKNSLDATTTFTLVLRPLSAAPLILEPISISKFSTKRISLKQHLKLSPDKTKTSGRWGNGSRSGSMMGSAELTGMGPGSSKKVSFSAWTLMKNRNEQLEIVFPFQFRESKRSNILHGLWWFPSPKTEAYYSLRNTSENPVEIELTLFTNGRRLKTEAAKIQPNSSRFLSIRELLGYDIRSTIGGVRLIYKGRPGTIIGRGMLVDESRGFSCPLNLHETVIDLGMDCGAELHAPALLFGKLDTLIPGSNEILKPHLLLMNTGRKTVTVQGTVYGKDSGGRYVEWVLKPLTLEPDYPLESVRKHVE